MESVGSAAPASVINACTQDCANFTLGAEFRKNSSCGARQGVGTKESISQGEGVAQSYDSRGIRLYK